MSDDEAIAAGRRYRRVILKISGESFAHPGERGISIDEVMDIARQTQRAAAQGTQIAVIIGGGNILRGAQFTSAGLSPSAVRAPQVGGRTVP